MNVILFFYWFPALVGLAFILRLFISWGLPKEPELRSFYWMLFRQCFIPISNWHHLLVMWISYNQTVNGRE